MCFDLVQPGEHVGTEIKVSGGSLHHIGIELGYNL